MAVGRVVAWWLWMAVRWVERAVVRVRRDGLGLVGWLERADRGGRKRSESRVCWRCWERSGSIMGRFSRKADASGAIKRWASGLRLMDCASER